MPLPYNHIVLNPTTIHQNEDSHFHAEAQTTDVCFPTFFINPEDNDKF